MPRSSALAEELFHRNDDPTPADIRRVVATLAVPALLEQVLSFLVGLVDTYLSGRFDADVTSAIGLSAYVNWLSGLMTSLVATGTAAIIAREWGGRRRQAASRTLNQSLVLGAAVGVGFLLVVTAAAPLFADALGLTGQSRAMAVGFVRLDTVGHVPMAVVLTAAAALRGAGDMRTPLYVLGGLNVVNVFASMVFVYGPPPAFGFDFIGFGPVGIIYGTIVAKLLGAAAILGVLASHRSPALRLVPRWMRPDRRAIARVLKIGLPAAAEGLVMWVGQFVFLGLVATVGRRAGVSEDVEADARAFIAAHFVGIRVEGISYLPAFAWGAAAATMTGQAIGAGRPKLGVTAGHIAAGQASALGAVLSLVFVFGADAIFAVMHDDPQVRAVGAPALRMIGFFQVPLVLAIVYVQALRGAGDTRWPLAMTVSGVYGLRLPLAYLGGMYWVGGLVGVWVGMAVDIAARAIVAAVRYRGEAWTRTRV